MLTERQKQLQDFLRRYQRQHGVMPSTRDIQKHFGFASQTAAMGHLRALERKGVIRRLAGKARAVVFPQEHQSRAQMVEIPVYGAIPAGFASDNPQQADRHMAVDFRALHLSQNANPFALQVRGDSMVGAHILDGDIVVLEQREPKSRDVVAALIDGESTLKRYLVERGRPCLRAENPRYPDLIPAHDLTIQGVMIGLVRSLGEK